MSDDKLAVELLAHRDSVARMDDLLREARGEAAFWRGRYCKVVANGGDDFERRIRENRLPWENANVQRPADATPNPVE